MKYLTFLALTLSDWALTKACLYLGCVEGNPVVEWVGGIDNGLILKIVCWSAAVVLVPISNNAWPNMGDKIFRGAIFFYAVLVLWNTYMLVGPVL
ncbi:hypothetical protein LCGC14_1735540 [marine sediment metagenome]|uniref:DUF5658 domain-containing protein n=1 Tax=marine sediment metagenome TaxID=412755 RepID=A0A0F9K7Y7_9ZZZZ